MVREPRLLAAGTEAHLDGSPAKGLREGLPGADFIEGIGTALAEGTPSPTWADQSISDHRPAPGLWAVEPHLAHGDIGVKWEELLVIEGSDAHWLDDAVPHLRVEPHH